MSPDRTTRTNTLHFGHGTATILVDHWLSDPQEGDVPTTDEVTCTVDHLMGTVVENTFRVMAELNRSILAKGLGEGNVAHVSTRSMAIDGVVMRVKVSLRLTREVPSYVLAMQVDRILQGTTPCMVHLLDRSLEDIEMPSLGGLLSGNMPEGVRVVSVPADAFARMAGGGSHHPAYGSTDDGHGGGQYL